MSIEDKVVWITGASSGIGEALAVDLAARGALVILSGRRTEALAQVARRIGPAERTLILPFDATGYDQLPAVVAEARNWHGRIDYLVNNAGISQRSLALDTGFDVYRHLMEVDFFAPVRLTQLVLPGMVERRSGHIAIVSSVAGKFGTPMRTGYCAAKHACVGFFDALRSEVETAYGVAVSVIVPGSVQTAIAVNAVTGDGSRRGRTDTNIAAGIAGRARRHDHRRGSPGRHARDRGGERHGGADAGRPRRRPGNAVRRHGAGRQAVGGASRGARAGYDIRFSLRNSPRLRVRTDAPCS